MLFRSRRRNIALETLHPLRGLPATFHSLQKGEPAESEFADLRSRRWDGPAIVDHASDLQDFSDTAALVSNLDLVISVDTSIAHLAAAMGRPVWLLNQYSACWRWLMNRVDSPWYPTLTQYRQPSPGDWHSVIASVTRDLASFVKQQSHTRTPEANSS